MLSASKKSLALDVLKAIFIFLFIYTAVSKLLDFRSFNIILRQSPLIGPYANSIAIFLPAVEILVAGLLIFPATLKTGLYTFLSLMLLFTAYIIYMTFFSSYLPCTCGGVFKYMTWNQHLLFNLGVTGLAVIAIRLLNMHLASTSIHKKLIAQ